MTRQEKQDLLAKLNEMYGENGFIFLVSMNAVTAENALSFRAKMRQNNAHCLVIKNTLNRIAAKNANVEHLNPFFSKQVLTIFAQTPVEVAKILEEYAGKGYEVLAGSSKTALISVNEVKQLAKVPPMPVLKSMLLSALLGMQRKTVRLISERAKSLQGSEEKTN